nr:LysR substrate-binding domain-containing protein [Burkholderia pseudomallei]
MLLQIGNEIPTNDPEPSAKKRSSEIITASPFDVTNASPRTTSIVASVTISELIRQRAISTPLTSPTAPPANTPAAATSSTPCVAVISVEATTPENAAIGAITSPGLRRLPPAVAAVKGTHANVRISVEIDTSNVLLERLARDKLDVVVGRLPAEHDKLRLRYEPLTGEPVAAVVRAGYPLLERAPLARADAQRAAWVVPPAGSVLRHRGERMFQRASLTPPANVVETAALLFVTRVLERSDMIAVLAEDIARYYATHGIVAMPPLEMDGRMDDFGIITRTDEVYAPAAGVTIEAIRDAAREIYTVAA